MNLFYLSTNKNGWPMEVGGALLQPWRVPCVITDGYLVPITCAASLIEGAEGTCGQWPWPALAFAASM